ncbi:hypothetical protein D3C76_1404970 [compost metagenome]
MPLLLVKSVIMPQITTSEIKYGIYETVWTTRLKAWFFTSLISKARMIGAGNIKIREYTLITIVLIRIRQK